MGERRQRPGRGMDMPISNRAMAWLIAAAAVAGSTVGVVAALLVKPVLDHD